MAFSNFYIDQSGANINAGDDKTVVTSTNGDWGNAAANRFTAAAGTPFSGVSVGDFASIYLDGATVAVYIGRVTAVNGGGASLDISTTAKSGTAPTTGATGRSCTVGGRWSGPSGAVIFPFGFVAGAMTNVAGDRVRVNVKGGTTYSVTSSMAHSVAGPVIWQGYTTTVGDGGQVTFDGGTSGASYVLCNNTGTFQDGIDLIFQNNGATGNANGVVWNGALSNLYRCKIASVRGNGLLMAESNWVENCEFTSFNQSNTASFGGISGFTRGFRLYIHDASGSNTCGIVSSNNGRITLSHSIISNMGADGIRATGATISISAVNCDFYGNGSDGIDFTDSSGNCYVRAVNCNFVKNGGYGIGKTGAITVDGFLKNCGFGAGTQANTSGAYATTLRLLLELTNVGSGSTDGIYASNVTPWTDPTTGDFNITLAAAIGAGAGAFLGTTSVAHLDIGAAQAAASSSGGSFSYMFGG